MGQIYRREKPSTMFCLQTIYFKKMVFCRISIANMEDLLGVVGLFYVYFIVNVQP